VAQLRQERAALDQAGIQVILVSMGTPVEAESFRQQYGVPFPIISDPEKHLYRAYGLKRAGLMQLFSPGLVRKGLQAAGEGHLPGIPQGDPMQMPGTFIIDQEGRLLLRHFARDAADYLPVASIIKAIRGQENQPLP
jgi:alkyl hydroperoxide reductase subunit AhpC